MTREQAKPYIGYILNDALHAEPFKDDQSSHIDLLPNAVLVGWQCGFEPMFVAVQSYLPDTKIDESEAVEIAMDYLEEIGWFSDEPTEPDHIIV